jgi:phosphoribosylanthranilate isomerase
MKKFRIKVCGITRPEDADLVARLGGDMVGFIFYTRSPRFVSKQQALKILAVLPPVVARVGVFVANGIDRILRGAERLHLDYVQLHGEVAPSQIVQVQKEGYRVIRSFSIRERADYNPVLASLADLCLLDHQTDQLPGGTGQAFDWSLRPPRKIPNLMLAGGITVKNVRRGVKLFDPMVIDVNSGVESTPGTKSAAKLRRFFKECDRLRYGN